MKYKALICDVDGTLIPNTRNGKLSNRVKELIVQTKDQIHIGIATARSYQQARAIIEELQLSAPCIITSGAQIFDPIKKTFYIEKILDPKYVKEIYEIAKSMQISLTIADEEGEHSLTKTYIPHKVFDIYTEGISLEKANEFSKKFSQYEDISIHKALSWGKEHRVNIIFGNPESNKQYGILEVAKILKISTHEIIGIGEGYNDFPMLMACGLKVAMGNAVEDVKEIADYIAPTVEEDGVADVIEKFIL